MGLTRHLEILYSVLLHSSPVPDLRFQAFWFRISTYNIPLPKKVYLQKVSVLGKRNKDLKIYIKKKKSTSYR